MFLNPEALKEKLDNREALLDLKASILAFRYQSWKIFRVLKF